jgi:hypothetical protein
MKVIILIIGLLLGTLQAWASRYTISSEDGIAYLDIGEAYWKGDWAHAINAQWSPAYSWILGLTLGVLRPSSYWEFPTVKLINFLIYLFAFGCFEFFLRRLRKFYVGRISASGSSFLEISEDQWWLLGYSLFAWFALKWIAVSTDTPDMLAAAFVFLSVGIIVNLEERKQQWFDFARLGLFLSLGYLSKTVMFPLSFVFLAVASLSVANFRKALLQTLLALFVFGLIAGPFIAAISQNKGAFTYGGTGKLNYAWLINPGRYVIRDHHWQGGPPGSGIPDHPTRQIFDAPAAFEFATPIGGTYPPWYDLAYWYEGIIVKFNFLRQLHVFIANSAFFFQSFLGTLISGYLILIAFGDRDLCSIRELRTSWKLLVPAVAGLAIYSISSDLQLTYLRTQPSTRLIAVFAVLLFAGVFSSVRLPNSPGANKLVASLTLATIVVVGGSLCFDAFGEFEDGRASKPVNWEISEELKKMDLKPGTTIAHLGFKEYNWARLARLKIVAEIPEAEAFWTANSTTRSEAIEKIRQTGARVIVQNPGLKISKHTLDQEGWRQIGNTDGYVYWLREAYDAPS